MSLESLVVSAQADGEYCRLCATRASPPSLRSFARSGVQADSLLASIRRLEPSIYRGDGLPQVACLDCLQQLNAVNVFQRRIAAAQVKIAEILMVGALQKDQFTLEEECTTKEEADSDISVTGECSHVVKRENNKLNALADCFNRTGTSFIGMENGMKEDFAFFLTNPDRQVKLTEISVVGTFNEDRLLLKEECTLKVESDHMDSSNNDSTNSNEDGVSLITSPLKYAVLTKKEDLPNGESDNGNLSQLFVEAAINVEYSHGSTLVSAPLPSQAQKCNKLASSAAGLLWNKNTKRKLEVAEPSASSTLPTRVAATTWRTAPTPSSEPGPRFTDYLCCRRCNLRFDSLQPLREHSWSEHARCIAFKCIYCPQRIKTFKHFYQHIPRHVAALRHCCEFCNKRFEFLADKKLHKKLQHAEEKKAHRCANCGMKFSTAEELKTHRGNYTLVTSSTAGGRNFKCSLCPKAFPNKIGLVGHMNSHDPTKNVCNICNKSYKTSSNLKHHLNTIHKDTLQYICHICGKGFKTKSNYNGHIGVHIGVKRFTCDTCSKTYRHKTQLRAHLVSHTENYLHVCKICNKTYKYNSSLKEHLNSHNEERPYSCELCPKTFLSWGNFNKHMKRIHDKNMSKKKQLLLTI